MILRIIICSFFFFLNFDIFNLTQSTLCSYWPNCKYSNFETKLTTNVGGSQDHIWVQWFSRKTHGYDFFTVKRVQSKINKGKRCVVKVQRKPGISFQEFSLNGGTHLCTCSYLSIRLTRSEVLPTRKLIRKSVLKVFIGVWWLKHPLPNTFQNSRILKGKQMYINHIVQSQLCEVTHQCRGAVYHASFQMPTKGQTWSKQALWRKAVLGLLC